MSFKVRDHHWEVLGNFMEKNRDFARGKLNVPAAREKYRKLWQELAVTLNSLGYGEKSVEKWQKTWTDFKSNLKRKASDIKRSQLLTGGDPVLEKTLSSIELRILNILGNTFYEGVGCEEQGLPPPVAPISSTVVLPPEDFRSTSSAPSTSCGRKRDHDYLGTPKEMPKKKKIDLDSVYEDTVVELRQIKYVIEDGFQKVCTSIDQLKDSINK